MNQDSSMKGDVLIGQLKKNISITRMPPSHETGIPVTTITPARRCVCCFSVRAVLDPCMKLEIFLALLLLLLYGRSIPLLTTAAVYHTVCTDLFMSGNFDPSRKCGCNLAICRKDAGIVSANCYT